MPGLGRPSNLKAPPRKPGLDFRPGMNQPVEALFRMDAAEREHHTLGRSSCHRGHERFGNVDPVGDDHDWTRKSEITDLLVFLFACCMNAGRLADRAALK